MVQDPGLTHTRDHPASPDSAMRPDSAIRTVSRKPGAASGFRRFFGSRKGNVAMIVALAFVPMILIVGLAIDLGRAYLVKSRLSYALDAAGLAVGSSTGTPAELQLVMDSFFDANYPAREIGVPARPEMTLIGDNVRLTATAVVDMTLMRAIGIDSIPVAATNLIIKETKGLEVVMVLDNTGSMGGSKIADLKTAAQELVDILFGPNDVAQLLKVGIVPFARAVNIGDDMAAYLAPVMNPGDIGLDDYDPDIWRGCVEARPYPYDSSDDTVGIGGAWKPYFYPYHSSRNPWPPIKGWRGERQGPNKECPVPVQPLTNLRAPLTATINAMDARGYTHINVGAVWGWRLLSPELPFDQGLPYDDPENQKAIIIMTDGKNTMPGGSGQYTAYGHLSEGRLGTTSSSAAAAELNKRLAEVCTAMKQAPRNIIVYTITFQLDDETIEDLMRDCASDPSKYFDSPSGSDLQKVFQKIARELSNLRIGM